MHDETERVPVSMALHHHPLGVSFAIFDPAHMASSFVSGIGAGSNAVKAASAKADLAEETGDEGVMILVDPIPLETTLCTSKLTVVANAQGEICVLDKAGGRPLSQMVLQRAIHIARRRVKELSQTMDKALEADASTRIVDVL